MIPGASSAPKGDTSTYQCGSAARQNTGRANAVGRQPLRVEASSNQPNTSARWPSTQIEIVCANALKALLWRCAYGVVLNALDGVALKAATWEDRAP